MDQQQLKSVFRPLRGVLAEMPVIKAFAPHPNKLRLVRLMGGQCVVPGCGFKKHPAAFHFHHLYPEQKKHSMAKLIQNASWTRIVQEASKCVLLCANCHAAYHAGQLPSDLDLRPWLGKFKESVATQEEEQLRRDLIKEINGYSLNLDLM